MKRLLILIALLLVWAGTVNAQTVKIVDLPEATAVTADDLFIVVDAPGSTAINKKLTFANLTAGITKLGLNTTVPANAGQISSILAANAIVGFQMRRFTDTAPTGKFLDFQNTAGGSVASIDINGNLVVASCTGCGVGGDVTGPASAIDSEIVLFSGTTGKVIKRATGTGIVHATAGVISVGSVDLATTEVIGRLPYHHVQAASAAAKLLGRGGAAGAGDWEEITLGTNLSMSGTTLNASGGAGGGDVTGPASATDNALTRFDGATGKIIQNSSAVLEDTGMLGVTRVRVGGTTTAFAFFQEEPTSGNVALRTGTDSGYARLYSNITAVGDVTTNFFNIGTAGGDDVRIDAAGVAIKNTGYLRWSSTSASGGAADLSLQRSAARTLQLTNPQSADDDPKFLIGTAGSGADTSIEVSRWNIPIASGSQWGGWIDVGSNNNKQVLGWAVNAQDYSAASTTAQIMGVSGRATDSSVGGAATEVIGVRALAEGRAAGTTLGTGSGLWAQFTGASAGGGTSGRAIDALVNLASSFDLVNAAVFRGVATLSNTSLATTLRGIDLSGWSKGASATVNTSYGIYIDSSIDIGTTKYAFYSLSASPSLFTGDVVNQSKMAIGGAAIASSRQINVEVTAAPTALVTGLFNRYTWASAPGAVGALDNRSTVTGGANVTNVSATIAAETTAGGAQDDVITINASSGFSGAGTLARFHGIRNSTVSTTGTVTELINDRVFAIISSGATITAGSLESLIAQFNGSSVGTFKGLDISGWTSATTTITTSYGIYMDTSIDVGTTKWALYSLSTSPSLFTGNLQSSGVLIAGSGPTTLTSAAGNLLTAALEGGAASPGNSKYYGTNVSGTKGFFDLPAGGAFYQTVQDNGTPLTQRAKVNFIAGANVTLTLADDAGNDRTNVTIASSGGAGGYATIQEEGSPLTQRATLNVVGTALTASDTGSLTQLASHAQVNSLADLATNGIIARTAANTLTARTITGTTNQVGVSNGDGVGGNPTLSTPQDIHTAATPQFARLGLGAAAAAVTSLKVAGPTINTDADGTIAIADLAFSITKNDTNAFTFPGVQIKPTLNTGASNSGTVVNVLSIDTVNTGTTGLATNLIKASYGGAAKFVLNSSGVLNITGTGVSGGTNLFSVDMTLVSLPTSPLAGFYWRHPDNNAGNATGLRSLYEITGTGTGGVIRGISSQLTQSASGNVNTFRGYEANLNTSGSGGVGTLVGYRSFMSVSTGTVGTLTGLSIDGWSNTGTVTTSYGIYMDATIDVGATRYALYSLSTSPSILTGPLQLGVASGTTGQLKLAASGDADVTIIQSGDTPASAVTYKWPADDPASGEQLTITSFSAGTAVLEWAAPGGGGGGTPGGSDGNLQYKVNASTFGGITGSNVSGGQVTLADKLTTALDNATTAAVDPLLDIQHSSSGTVAAEFGSRIRFGLESDTTPNRDAAAIDGSWEVATDASRKGQLRLWAGDSTQLRNVVTIRTAGAGNRGILYLGNPDSPDFLGHSISAETNDMILRSPNASWAFYDQTNYPALQLSVAHTSGVDADQTFIHSPQGTQQSRIRFLTSDNSGTGNTYPQVRIVRNNAGTPSTGFGTSLNFLLESTTTESREAAQMAALWTTATDTGRTAVITISTVNNATALAERARFDVNGLTVGVAGASIGKVLFSGDTSGVTTVQPATTASGTLTLPAATDTLVGRATGDSLTNKTYNGLTVSTTTGTFTLTNGKTLSVSNSLTLAGTDATTMTFPAESVNVGTLEIRQNSQSAAYTLVIGDSGKHIYHPSADTTARTWTIPANASVPFPIGTAVTFVNDTGAGTITIAITTDTLVLAGTGATGSRTLAAGGVATAVKVTSTRWIISGTGLT